MKNFLLLQLIIAHCSLLIAPQGLLAQTSLSYLVFDTGTERFCADDQMLVSPLVPDSFVVRDDARVTLWSRSGITLKPGFKASGWTTGGSFRAIVAPQPCYTYIWKGTVSTEWADAHNWQPMGVPGAQDAAIIEAAPNAPIYIGVGEGVRRLVMNGEQLTLRAPLTVGDTLLLTSGIIYTPVDTAALMLADDALALSASDSSYVEGRVVKVGDDGFVFPVGRNGRYRPIAMSAPSSTGAEFRAQYLNLDVSGLHDVAELESPLVHVSTNEYWLLDRLASTNTVTVTLSWTDMSCAFDELADLRVTGWDGTEWADLGNGGTTGNTDAGTIVTGAAATIYGAFTLASVDSMECVPCRADAGADIMVWEGMGKTIGTTGNTEGASYLWVPGTFLTDSTVPMPFCSPTTSQTYAFEVTNGGCTATDWMTVEVRDPIRPSIGAHTELGYYGTLDLIEAHAKKYQGTADSLTSREKMKWRRWIHFWNSRVDSTGLERFGRFDHYSYAMAQLAADGPCGTSWLDDDWSQVGSIVRDFPNNQRSGRVDIVRKHPTNDDILFAGTNSSGLFKGVRNPSTNEWEWVNITAGALFPEVGIQDISFNPIDPDDILIATGSKAVAGIIGGVGILRSTDGGDEWHHVSFTPVQYMSTSLRLSRCNSGQTVYAMTQRGNAAGGSEEAEIWKSTDYGEEFYEIYSAANTIRFNETASLVVNPNDCDEVYFTGKQAITDREGVFVTMNGFSTVQHLTAPFGISDVLGGSAPWPYRRVMLSYAESPFKVYIGMNISIPQAGHQVWAGNMTNGFVLHHFPAVANDQRLGMSFMVMPEMDNIIVHGSVRGRWDNTANLLNGGMLRTGTFGGTVHDDQRRVTPYSANQALLATDGGVSLITFTENSGNVTMSTQDLNGSGLDITQFWGIGITNAMFRGPQGLIDSDAISGGTQDNGHMVFRDEQWRHADWGDSYDAVISDNEPSVHFYFNGGGDQRFIIRGLLFGGTACYMGGSLDTDLMTTYPTCPGGCDQDCIDNWVTNDPPIEMDAAGTLYAGFRWLNKRATLDPQSEWSLVNDFSAFQQDMFVNTRIEVIRVHKTDPNHIYVGISQPYWDNGYRPRLLYSSNGGVTFEDVNAPANLADPDHQWVFRWNGLADIVINPNDPTEIWVGRKGFSSPGNQVFRVHRNSEGKWVWESDGEGLPDIPISRLTYQENSPKNTLYASNEIGVFIIDDNMRATGGWRCYYKNLPNTIIQDMEMDYCNNRIVVGTYGRGVWSSPMQSYADLPAKSIEEDETWEHFRYLLTDLIIQPGAHLTIKAQVNIPENRKITVMPGAKLTVDGGTLTNTCGDNWQGVEVLGTPNVPPSLTIGGSHGWLRLINGATIEHAKAGATSIDGGMVRSTGGSGDNRITFRNCRKGVVLSAFSNGGTQTTGSILINTDFICDAPMNHPSYVSNGQRVGVNAFVTAWLHPRVTVSGCTFTNTLDYVEDGEPGSFPPPVRGIGIIAIDTRFDVQNCDFTGLYRGIDMANTMYAGTVLNVTGSDFVNNMQGITSAGSFNDRIHHNEFKVPDVYWGNTLGFPDVDSWGVYMLRGTHHRVTHNDFSSVGPDMALVSRGFINKGMKGTNVETGGRLMHNTFSNTFIGTQTEENNILLQMRCNTYNSDMQYDWAINPQTQQRILGPQGTGCVEENPSYYRAGNVFLNNAIDDEDHILSWAQAFDYYYVDADNQKPTVTITAANLNDWECDPVPGGDPSCVEPTSPGPVVLDDRRRALDWDIAQLKAERLALIDDLDSLGTKTSVLLARMEDTTYSNSTLTTELLQWSLLSDTVLRALCLRHPPLAEAQFTEVVIANSPVTRTVWQDITTIVFPDLKRSWADSISLAQRTDTVRTVRVIERETEIAATERFHVVMDYLDIFMDRDTIPDSTYTAIHYMVDSLVTNEWRKLAVGTAFSLDTLTLTRSLLDGMSLTVAEDSAFYSLHDLAIILREDTLTWFDMDSTQYALIVNLADGETLMKEQALTILALLSDTSIAYRPEQLPEEPSLKLSEEEDDETAVPMSEERMDEHVKVYPNPFQNAFTVQYSFPEEVRELRFEVFDLTGRKLLEEKVMNTKSASRLLDLGHCKGLYLLRVTADGRRVRSEKLICIERQ